ncbi:uncharacterized protein VDAG_07896 [Verticillium dahliae VdLs.17]|uniref:HNH nuclease domain-containing protein n=1 Tax=Verticillium dahliae (strain VdLs.17 / ATCC MYA-4575 / FGSC 10137) TaxID=498257 RepID=G2XCL4_VERDV|nr:uncharacterized protein VDAG_07896 [Verticillium dahliae VdLs.17]EGY16732.1 hypothetical protein VDAG_07896 [Verticillium dahliae VdLs.17]KAH6706899.1 hypothetical protein EV126DRAFT_457299 [Verticillium dahliae]
MSSAAVTPSMRAVGWNVHFTAGHEDDPGAFAGIYQVPGSDLVTFRQVCDELRLCFKLPNDPRNESHEVDLDPWSNVAFALVDQTDWSRSSMPLQSFVTQYDLDQSVPSLSPLRPKEQNVLRYHLVYHRSCNLPSSSSLETHLQARSQSPSKRSVSGSNSPSRDDLADANDDLHDMLVPASMKIDFEAAKKVMSEFKASCLNRGTSCAVSGKGETWCPGQSIGPGVQACHIVPQQHYHLYPRQYADDNSFGEDVSYRLQQAWQRTWSSRNGILMMKHLHEFFDARLFSIHPDTLRVRVYVPYDDLMEFNGRTASVPASIDRKALRHHCEMCCIENMAAERPISHVASPSTSRLGTSGTGTPLRARTELPATPGSRTAPSETIGGKTGDPSKRPRSTYPDRSLPRDALEWGAFADQAEAAERGRKRRRPEDCLVDEACSQSDWIVPEGRHIETMPIDDANL